MSPIRAKMMPNNPRQTPGKRKEKRLTCIASVLAFSWRFCCLILAHIWPILTSFWTHLGHLGFISARPWPIWASSQLDLRISWPKSWPMLAHFGPILADPGFILSTYKCPAKIEEKVASPLPSFGSSPPKGQLPLGISPPEALRRHGSSKIGHREG